jgi:exodeoxyribonuclease V gamma subunit
MFHVHRSNRMEELSRALAEVVREPAGSAFEPELILVQSKGIERWLSLELSRSLGVFANARFPFPRAFIDELLETVLADGRPGPARWTREALTWSIARSLPELAARPGFSLVSRYIADDPRGRRRFQLARRIANVFDQYAVYRPELVLGWEAGAGGDDWQPVLWRAIASECGSRHLAARAGEFLRRWAELGELPPGLPRRLSVFGLSTLPPIHLRLLAALSQRLDVHLFLLDPAREFWAQIRSKREIASATRDSKRLEGELHLAEGNALLASLGRVGRDFQQLLEESVDYVEDRIAKHVDPGTHSLLSALQSDVLNLVLRGSGPGAAAALPVGAEDSSLEIHSCHGPMREVEILRDRLLGMFDEDPSLQPHDVIVMMPDVDRYAPLIDAVFGVDQGSELYIPYRIADRSQRAESEVAAALLALIEIVSGRMKASELLDLLQLESVRARFGIAADEIARIQRWVHESGVRWGADAEHRAELGQPALEQNSWRFGLSRLLLGWAMPGQGRQLFGGVLPYDDVEGDAAQSIGRLSELVETLIDHRRRFAAPRRVADWKHALGELLADCVCETDKTGWELRRVRELLAELALEAELAGFEEPISLDVMAELCAERLDNERTTHEFLTGGVSFCALLPMRSIPFRVVCLIGMSDEDFPRRDRAPAFDLITHSPRLGDRSLRDEDRHLFLEAVLAARERLLVTYVGRGIQDDRARPPSVVLAELLDAIDDGFVLARDASTQAAPRSRARARPVAPEQMALPFAPPKSAREPSGAERASERLLLAHPLQPFSPRYFQVDASSRLFSYASDEAEGARALAQARTTLTPFVSRPLPEPDPGAVDLDELARFFENPTRGFLRRLGVEVEDRIELVQDREPIEPGALEQYGVGQRLVERVLRGEDLSDAELLLRAEGLLPAGAPGRRWLAELAPQAAAIAAAASALRGGARLAPHPLALELGGTRLVGVLAELFPLAQLRCSYSRLKAKNLLALWIRHLALACAPPAGHAGASVLVGRPRKGKERQVATATFRPLPERDARGWLAELVELHRLGRCTPLSLFPAAAEVYVQKLAAGEAESALAAARTAFADQHAFGERSDSAISRVFGDRDPLGPGFSPSFTELAERVFGPLRAHMTEALV